MTRDPGRVLEDVRNELVSRETALDTYGVVLTDALEIDHQAKEERRRSATAR